MNGCVPYGLICCFATVHTNIEFMRGAFHLQIILDLPNRIECIHVFLVGHIQDGYNVSRGNNQGMTFGNGKAIEESEGQMGLSQHWAIRRAEDVVELHCLMFRYSHDGIFVHLKSCPPGARLQTHIEHGLRVTAR